MISLYKNQLALWILLYILDHSTSFEYGTIWTNLNNKQLCGVPPSAPWKAWQRLYYDNSNKIIGLKQLPYINGPRYGKVNITNFGNYETINNKHGAKSLRHDDRDQIIENTKENVLLSSRSKTFSLIGYDEEIYKIMQKFTMSEQTGPIVVYFYLSQNHTYSSIGLLRTTPRILDSILSKYNYFNCVNSNHIMIPRKNNIFYADECLKDCDRLVTNIKLKDSDNMEYYVDCFANSCLNGKNNYQNNIVINNENSFNINDSPAKHSIDKYYSEKPSPIRDSAQHIHSESYYNPIPVREFMSHPSHLESNEFKLKAYNNDNNFEIIKNNVDTQTTNTSPAKNLNNAIILEGNFIKENFKPPEINYDPSSNNKIDTYISYGKNKNLQQMYNTKDDQRAVDNINYKEDQNGQLVFPYKLTSSEIFDTALANNRIEYLPSQKLLKEKSLFPKQYLNSPSIAEVHYSIPRILPYSSIKSDIQKNSSAYPTNENIKHFNYVKPRLFPAYAQTFDSESLNSNPSLPYTYKPETGYNMQRYNLVETNESKASIAKLSAIPYELKSSHIPKLNQYNIVSEKSPDPSTLTYIHTPTALQRPGFYAQKGLQNLKVVPSQGLISNTFKQNLQTVPLLAYKKPVPVINKKINSDYIPSVSYYTLYSFNKPHSVSPKGYSPTNFISYNPESNINEISMDGLSKSKSKYLPRCDDKLHLSQTPFSAKDDESLPRHTNEENTPSVKFTQWKPILLAKDFIEPNFPYNVANHKNKITPFVTPSQEVYQTIPKTNDVIPLDVEYTTSKIPSFYDSQNPNKIISVLPKTGSTENYKTSVESPKLPFKKDFNPKKLNVIPHYQSILNKKAPTWVQKYQPVDGFPSQNVNQNLFTKNFKSNDNQERDPIIDLDKATTGIPQYKVFNAPNAKTTKYYCPSNRYPSFLNIQNDNNSPTTTTTSFTSRNPTPQSQHSLFTEPQDKNNKVQSISNGIASPCHFPPLSQTSKTYKPQFSEKFKELTHQEAVSHTTEPQNKSNEEQSISNRIASSCYFPPLTQTSKTCKPQISKELKELTQQETIPRQNNQRNFKNLELPLASCTSYKNPSLYVPNYFNNIPPNPQLATLSTATYHPDTEIQNSPAVNFAQPLKILDEKEYFKSPNVEYYNPTSKFKAKPFITPLTPRVELLPPKRKNMDLLNAAYFPSKINTICNNTAFSETSKLSDIDDTNNYLASVEVPKVPPRISLNRDEIKNIKNTPSTLISQHTPSWIKKYYHYPLQTLHNLPIKINKQHIFEKPAIPMSHKETKLGQNRITESYDFPMSQILQSYRPQPLEVPKLSKQNDELTPQSKTKVTEFEPPQHQQPDFQNVTFSQANGSSYRISPLNPYNLKSILRNVQPARAPTATNQQSNLNFNQERNIKELHGNLYFQRNGQGLPNLANKGPVSSTTYIHKHPPFEFTNPMWTISPQTLSNNSLEPKQQIKFAPMENSLEQIKWYKNIPCYTSGDHYKIQNPKLNYVKPFDYETNGYYPKISKQKGLQPCVSNTAKFYDTLILNPHTTSSQTKPTNLALEPTRFSSPEKLWTATLNHDLRTPEYFPTFSTTQIKYYTPPVTKNVNPIKQPLVCVNNNKINYYKKPINPSSIRKTICFTPDYQQGINVENASRKVSPNVYQPQHPIHKNFTKLSTLHKPLQSYLEPEKSLASHYEMPKALVKFSSVAPTERIKYNIWPAKYSQNLSTRSPISSSSNLQQNSPYSSRPSQNQENNINQINNIVKNQFVKEPVSYIQGRGRSNGHKYDTLRNDSPCSLLSVPIPMNSYSPSASIISKKSGIPKPYPKSTFNSKTKANPTLKLNPISTSAVAPIINKPKTQSYPYINQQSTQCVFNTLFEDLKDSSGNHRILTSAVAPFINITPSLEMQPNPYKYTPKLKNLKDSKGFRIPASAVTPITNIYSKIPSLKAWSNPYKYTPTFKDLKDSSANNRIPTSAETPIIDITPSFKTKSNTYKYTPLEDLKNVKKKSVDHRIPTSAETPIIIIIPSFKTKLNPYKYATIEDLKDVAVDYRIPTSAVRPIINKTRLLKTRTNPYKYAPFEDLKDSGSAHRIPASAVAPFINIAPSLETRPNSYKYTPFEDFKDSGGNPRIPTLAVTPIINMTPSLKTRTNPYKYTPLEDLQDSGGNYRTPTLAVAPIINMTPSLKTRTNPYKYTLLEDLQDSGGNYRTPTLAVAPIIKMIPSLKTRTNPYKYTPFEDLKDSGVLYHRITTSAVAPIINITPSLNIRPNPYKYTPTYFKDQKDGGGNFIIPTSGVTPIMNMTPYKYTPFKDRKDSGGYHRIQTSAESPIINITPSLKTQTNPYKYTSFKDLIDSGGSHGIPVSSETPVTNIAPFLKTRSNPYKYIPVKDHKDISSANHRISASANTSIMKKVPSLKTRPNPYKYTPTYFKDEKYDGVDLRIPTSGVTPIINMTPYKYTPFKDRKDGSGNLSSKPPTSAVAPYFNILPALKTRYIPYYKYKPSSKDLKYSEGNHRIPTSAADITINITPSLKTRASSYKNTPFEDLKNCGDNNRIPTSSVAPIINIAPSLKTQPNPYKYTPTYFKDQKDGGGNFIIPTSIVNMTPFKDRKDSGDHYRIQTSAESPIKNIIPSLKTRSNTFKYTPFEDPKNIGANITPPLRTRSNTYENTPTFKYLKDSDGNHRIPTPTETPIIKMTPSSNLSKYTPIFKEPKGNAENNIIGDLINSATYPFEPYSQYSTRFYAPTPNIKPRKLSPTTVQPLQPIAKNNIVDFELQKPKHQYKPVAYSAPLYNNVNGNRIGNTENNIKHTMPYHTLEGKTPCSVFNTYKSKTSELYDIKRPTKAAYFSQNRPYDAQNSFNPINNKEKSSISSSQIPAVSWAPQNILGPAQTVISNPQNRNVPRLTENTSNLYETDVPLPKVLGSSYNFLRDKVDTSTHYKPSFAVPPTRQSLGKILPVKQSPVQSVDNLFKNVAVHKSDYPVQNILYSYPTQGNQHNTEEFTDLRDNYVKPFKCIKCDCKVCERNPTILDQIIKQLYAYSKTLPDKFYESRAGFTNGKISIPFRDMGLAKYEITKPNEYFVKTEIPGLFIKAWGSRIKIIRPRLVLDVKEYEGYNFMPVIKNHYYSPEFAQNVAKDIVTRLYGEPIVIDGVYSPTSPYAVIDDINNAVVNDGKAYILWPTLCNCGCMKSGCKCCFRS